MNKEIFNTDTTQDWQNNGKSKTNSVQQYFNKKMVGKSLVDVRQNEVRVAIKIPRKQQAHDILKKIEPQIHEEITHMHPNYYFFKTSTSSSLSMVCRPQTLRYTCVVVREVINTSACVS
ncbi:hypothetical protein [Staphylococcus saprophyticus]|uniref:hypothetical protein n=1 Tax=Staphylococcus saprophyticus TaxID=29385 RepID=UPI0034DD74F9